MFRKLFRIFVYTIPTDPHALRKLTQKKSYMLVPSPSRRDSEDYGDQILSKVVKAGRRTYFFDVRATRGDDWFLTITESRKITAADGSSTYDRHKIFLYKEDLQSLPTVSQRSWNSSAAAREFPNPKNEYRDSEKRKRLSGSCAGESFY